MKRALSMFLLVLLVLVPLAAAHADPPDDQCPSPYSSDGHHTWQVSHEAAPTCTEPGSKTWICADCDKTYTETLPALGHDYTERVDREPTCTEAGHAWRFCSRCSDRQEVTIPALGHNWTSAVTEAPTCANPGVKTYTCVRCGATATESIPKVDHTPKSVPAQAPTCTEAGYTEGTKCDLCGVTLSGLEAVPAKGHTPVSVPGKAATCTEAGLTDGSQCSVCGAVLTAQQTIPAKGHTPVAVPGKAATCTEAGLTDGSKCSACGAVLTAQQTIPALGHTFGEGKVTTAPTCADKGYRTYTCTRCGATKLESIPPTGEHAWDEGVITTEPQGLAPGVKTFTCTVCGATKTENVDPTLTIFSGLRNVPPEGDPLVIVDHPLGGWVPYDGSGSMELFVTAKGGQEPYTYQWYYEPVTSLSHSSHLTDLVAEKGAALAETYNGLQEAVKPAAADAYASWLEGASLSGKPAEEAQSTDPLQPLHLNATALGDDGPTLEVTQGACLYWCVVTDSLGNTAASNKAQVDHELYIAVQPQDANLYGLKQATLSCAAAGGSGSYAYRLRSEEGDYLTDALPDAAAVPVSQEGNYFFEVQDTGMGQTLSSQVVTVFSAEIDVTPVITQQPQGVTVENDSVTLTCQATAFDGDRSALEYQWQKKMASGWQNVGKKGAELQRTGKDALGSYRCKVTDTRNGASVKSKAAQVNMKKLTCTITDVRFYIFTNGHINESGTKYTFPSGRIYIDYNIEGGIAPYWVKLIIPGYSQIWKYLKNTSGSYTFKTWITQHEYFHIQVTDALGKSASTQKYWAE